MLLINPYRSDLINKSHEYWSNPDRVSIYLIELLTKIRRIERRDRETRFLAQFTHSRLVRFLTSLYAASDIGPCPNRWASPLQQKKPALIHSRYAWRDALDSVREAQLDKAVFHWYTGTSGVLRDIVGEGYFISATPAVEYHEEHRRAVKEIPLERMLLETDSPVVYRRGSELEYESRPADVLRSLRGAAALKGVSEAQLAEVTTDNALGLFGL